MHATLSSRQAPQMMGVTAIVPGRREVGIEPLYLRLTLSSSEPEKRLDPPRASYLPFLLLSLPPPFPVLSPGSLLGAGSRLFGSPVKGCSAVTSPWLDKP